MYPQGFFYQFFFNMFRNINFVICIPILAGQPDPFESGSCFLPGSEFSEI